MATILNSLDDKSYVRTYPKLKPVKEGEILEHMIYTYILDLNPTEEVEKNYIATIDEWNKDKQKNKMEMIVSNRKYINFNGTDIKLRILGSCRKFVNNNQDLVIAEVHKDAVWFAERGFTVCRERIATLNANIKQRHLTEHPSKYYECSFLLKKRDSYSERIDKEDLSKFDAVYRHFKSNYKTPIMLEWYDAEKQVETLWLMMHFRDQTHSNITQRIDSIKDTIANNCRFVVKEARSEYCWYDSFPIMDVGSLDYTEEELQGMHGRNRGTEIYKKHIEDL